MKCPLLSLLLVLFMSTVAPLRAQSVRLAVALDAHRPLSQDIHGANNECLFRPVWFDHPAYAEKYLAAGRPFFRYPGGTGSNFYNPFTGYYDEESPSTRDYTGHNKRVAQFTDGAGRVPDEYFRFVKEHNVRYSLVLNVCTQTFEQNKAWLEKIAEEGHRVTAIEIGNEVFYGSYKWAFAAGAEYLDRAKKLTAVIRELLPETKVGVVLPNQMYQYDNLLTDDRSAGMDHPYGWIAALEGETFYDAVILHVYSLTGMANDVKPEDFIPHIEGYNNCDAHLDHFFDKTLETLETRFSGKEIWMTEYGVGGFGGNLKQYNLRFSHLGALHADVMLLRFIKRPSVTVAHWHSFQHFWDFVGGPQGIGDKEHLPYTHFSVFRDAIRNSHAVVDMTIQTRGDSAAAEDLESIALVGEDRVHVLVINRHDNQYTVEQVAMTDTERKLGFRLTGGIQLTHRADRSLAEAMQDTERCERVEISASNGDSITLPAYSITRLEYDLSRTADPRG
ncbi:hypothetical protein Poly41_49960 [Novipirellula artificiosorum]|uniref:Non-reducing end alpha-L-arabinofuranosidase n=2 Tax=Novipirellula artificiosorum TaxID=2528016 RepID=A0A5C6DBM2_9BACT|nr:hypothetical protein Poly41_49960 [Novipirellula artificiosorum]